MRKGKLQQSVLVRSVFKMLGQKREDAAGPAVGRGVSALAGEKETQVFSCAPVLVKDPEDAVLADTSGLDFEQSCELVCSIIKEKL